MTIIDLRDYKTYRLRNDGKSVNIPFSQLRKNIELIRTLEQPLYVVCACVTGKTGDAAVDILEEFGIEANNGGNWVAPYIKGMTRDLAATATPALAPAPSIWVEPTSAELDATAEARLRHPPLILNRRNT